MLCAVWNKSWKQKITKQLYGNLPPSHNKQDIMDSGDSYEELIIDILL